MVIAGVEETIYNKLIWKSKKEKTYTLSFILLDEACDCKRDRSWVRFPQDKMKYLIF